MTFPASAFRYLQKARTRFGIGGRCLTLGSNPRFMRASALSGAHATAPGDELLSDRAVLGSLDFTSVSILDSRPGDGVDLVADLNRLDPGLAAAGPFDFVLDWGASSRLFRIPNYLRNLLTLTGVGGVVWHIAPTDNLFGRGGYQLCPTLFHDYYTTNRWQILDMHSVHVQSWHDDDWFATPYSAGTLDWMCFGGAPAGAHLVSVLVRRTPDSVADRIPQQSWFTRWTSTTAGQAAADPGAVEKA
jgi:hypothetical protein